MGAGAFREGERAAAREGGREEGPAGEVPRERCRGRAVSAERSYAERILEGTPVLGPGDLNW